MSLETYNRKRDFSETAEPEGKPAPKHKGLRFVVQRHEASKLHYDFRLEMEGVLKSWAVPKGPSMSPGDKRLAMMVEDHPFAYRTFEGDIPAGNYGAGHVAIWDEGTYVSAVTDDPKEMEGQLLKELEKGSLKFILYGKKLQGQFSLVRMKGRQENAWLLLKKDDEFAVDEYDAEDFIGKKGAKKSVKKKPENSLKTSAKASPKNGKPDAVFESVLKIKEHETNAKHKIKPMLATLHGESFDDDSWLFEMKFDGYRAIAEIEKGDVHLYSRNFKSFNETYEPIVDALRGIEQDAVIDGEVVVLDEKGRSDFQLLQQYIESQSENIFYYAFDLLRLNGYDIQHLPLHERKELLKKIIPQNSRIRYSDHVIGKGKAFFKEAQKSGLEGIVAKRVESAYQTDVRSDDWLKIKVSSRQEAIICGFTEPRGTRKQFGALILGVYEKGVLKHAGNCGSGFDQKTLKELRETFEPYIIPESPFPKRVPAPTKITFLKPQLVCEVEFGGWTQDNIMRHPIFQGLRGDKPAEMVVREREGKTNYKKDMPARSIKTASKTTSKKSAKSDFKSDEKPGLDLNGIHVPITNFDKVYWPEEGYTKGDVIAYYQMMAKYILPYLKDRAESLNRHPNGIEEKGFYQKDVSDSVPEWVETVEVFSESNGRDIQYLVCQNEATLAYMNNLGCIEINPWNSRIQTIDRPDYIVIDLDPSDKNTFDEVIQTAKAVKKVLDKAKVEGFLKTSGATGLHIYIPLGAKYTFEQGKDFAHLIAQLTHDQLPELTSLERSPKDRREQIYIDYLQNRSAQTLAAPYSVRPKPGATVSTPLKWTELKKGLHPSKFTIATTIKRVKRIGDIFKGVLGEGINMEMALDSLGK
ncbi:MAG TPA: DNA ligase D [Patescibacteria group bacterium]|nr:DNA ligase D [Patescibacteria group bacterium]